MKKANRASVRIAKKSVKKYAEDSLPPLKRKRIESILKRNNNVWTAVKRMYNVSGGNVSSRNIVSPYFQPTMRKYNASKNRFVTGQNANRAIKRALIHKNIVNMLVPFRGSRGGVHSGYVENALKHTNIKYGIVNDKGKLKSFALVKNSPNSRYINVISGYTSYGHPMINKVISNARNAGKKRVNLKAVLQNKNKPNNDPLVKWYSGKGFKPSGNATNNYLFPMSRVF